ncbi:MAG TPA: hypothetical protein VGM23_15500, partial [Armatimonadota bacterium]
LSLMAPAFLRGNKINWWMVAGVLLLFLYGVDGALHPSAFFLLKCADLFIHEIGHGLFSAFGETLTVMGGSLLQLLIPMGATTYFLLTKQRFGAVFSVFWIGVNFFDVAIYMADARALRLPLATFASDSDSVIHDWNFLFDRWHVLMYDVNIAAVVNALGWLLLIASLLLGLWYAFGLVRAETITDLEHLEEVLEADDAAEEPAGPTPVEHHPVVVTDFLKGSKE